MFFEGSFGMPVKFPAKPRYSFLKLPGLFQKIFGIFFHLSFPLFSEQLFSFPTLPPLSLYADLKLLGIPGKRVPGDFTIYPPRMRIGV
jgi:hypothetical protein